MDTKLDITGLHKAVSSMKKAMRVYALRESEACEDEKELLRAGIIQNFEFTYELCWKFMKRWIAINISAESVDGVTRRELFRQAAENRLIADVDLWMKFHQARNQTSHIYDEDVAETTFLTASQSLQCIINFVSCLEARL